MSARTPVVAVMGSPNSGKTTLYNWLTHSNFKTVNYPGSTVEISLGHLAPQLHKKNEKSFQVMDTPGTYSLFAKSADEEVTRAALLHREEVERAVLVVDGTQLERHLQLAQQLTDCGVSFVIAVTMADLLEKQKLALNTAVVKQAMQAPVVLIDGLSGKGLPELVKAIHELPPSRKKEPVPWTTEQIAQKKMQLRQLQGSAWLGLEKNKFDLIYEKTARLDRFFLHPMLGPVLFVLIMFFLFSSIFWLAKPFMNGLAMGFSWLSFAILSLSEEALWGRLLANGVVDGIGAVMVFVPQILILFCGIGFLEASGYLARAATLVDHPFSKLGMSGRSFVPLLSAFACAVPAMMATRNISSGRDRWITNFIIPLMTCSARLPVYSLLLAVVFYKGSPWLAGMALAGIYFLSLILGALAATILNKVIKRNEKSLFMMELPLYRQPRLRPLLKAALSRTTAYVKKAGPVIFVFSVVIWAGSTFPNYQEKNETLRLRSSYLARTGQVLEPVFAPMGADWRVGVGLLSAFVARETFVSSLALLMNAGNAQPTIGQSSPPERNLLSSLNEATDSQGMKIFTLSHTLALILFFMLAMQCLSTFAVAVRELHSLFWALVQLLSFNVVAYGAAVLTVRIFHTFGL